MAQQLRQDDATDEEASWATEALKQENDTDREALEAELKQERLGRVEELYAATGSVAGGDSSEDDPHGLLAAEREAQRLRDAQLSADAAKKREDLENRLKLKRRKLMQQLRQDAVSEEEADLAAEELELEQDIEREDLEAELSLLTSNDDAAVLKAGGEDTEYGQILDDDPDALLRAEREAQRSVAEKLAAEEARRRAQLEKRLKLKRRKLAQELRHAGASEEDADIAAEALEFEQDAEREALETELAQIRSDELTKTFGSGTDVAGGPQDAVGDPNGLLRAAEEARRKLEAKLKADEEAKREALRKRLAGRQRERLQDLQTSELATEEVEEAMEMLELEAVEEHAALESELEEARTEVLQKIGIPGDAVSTSASDAAPTLAYEEADLSEQRRRAKEALAARRAARRKEKQAELAAEGASVIEIEEQMLALDEEEEQEMDELEGLLETNPAAALKALGSAGGTAGGDSTGAAPTLTYEEADLSEQRRRAKEALAARRAVRRRQFRSELKADGTAEGDFEEQMLAFENDGIQEMMELEGQLEADPTSLLKQLGADIIAGGTATDPTPTLVYEEADLSEQRRRAKRALAARRAKRRKAKEVEMDAKGASADEIEEQMMALEDEGIQEMMELAGQLERDPASLLLRLGEGAGPVVDVGDNAPTLTYQPEDLSERQRRAKEALERRRNARRKEMEAKGASDDEIEQELEMLQAFENEGMQEMIELEGALDGVPADDLRALGAGTSSGNSASEDLSALDRLKKQHDEDVRRLKNEAEKAAAAKREALEERLRGRFNQKVADLRESGADEAVLEAAESLMQAEIDVELAELDVTHEQDATAKIAALRLEQAGAVGAEPDEALAFDELKAQHDREEAALRAALAAEKRRRQAQLKEKLAKRKAAKGAGQGADHASEETVAKAAVAEEAAADDELAKLDLAFEAEEAKRLAALEAEQKLQEAKNADDYAQLEALRKQHERDQAALTQKLAKEGQEKRRKLEDRLKSRRKRPAAAKSKAPEQVVPTLADVEASAAAAAADGRERHQMELDLQKQAADALAEEKGKYEKEMLAAQQALVASQQLAADAAKAMRELQEANRSALRELESELEASRRAREEALRARLVGAFTNPTTAKVKAKAKASNDAQEAEVLVDVSTDAPEVDVSEEELDAELAKEEAALREAAAARAAADEAAARSAAEEAQQLLEQQVEENRANQAAEYEAMQGKLDAQRQSKKQQLADRLRAKRERQQAAQQKQALSVAQIEEQEAKLREEERAEQLKIEEQLAVEKARLLDEQQRGSEARAQEQRAQAEREASEARAAEAEREAAMRRMADMKEDHASETRRLQADLDNERNKQKSKLQAALAKRRHKKEADLTAQAANEAARAVAAAELEKDLAAQEAAEAAALEAKLAADEQAQLATQRAEQQRIAEQLAAEAQAAFAAASAAAARQAALEAAAKLEQAEQAERERASIAEMEAKAKEAKVREAKEMKAHARQEGEEKSMQKKKLHDRLAAKRAAQKAKVEAEQQAQMEELKRSHRQAAEELQLRLERQASVDFTSTPWKGALLALMVDRPTSPEAEHAWEADVYRRAVEASIVTQATAQAAIELVMQERQSRETAALLAEQYRERADSVTSALNALFDAKGAARVRAIDENDDPQSRTRALEALEIEYAAKQAATQTRATTFHDTEHLEAQRMLQQRLLAERLEVLQQHVPSAMNLLSAEDQERQVSEVRQRAESERLERVREIELEKVAAEEELRRQHEEALRAYEVRQKEELERKQAQLQVEIAKQEAEYQAKLEEADESKQKEMVTSFEKDMRRHRDSLTQQKETNRKKLQAKLEQRKRKKQAELDAKLKKVEAESNKEIASVEQGSNSPSYMKHTFSSADMNPSERRMARLQRVGQKTVDAVLAKKAGGALSPNRSVRSPRGGSRSPRSGSAGGNSDPALSSQLSTVQQRLERIEALMLEIRGGGGGQTSSAPALGAAPSDDISSDYATNSRILEYATAAESPELLRYLSAYRDT